ncbi:hypothetical protein AB6A40_006279 [Gnathostoma spinigerum]|uniref:Uncharacterized protein n=1 Tax=Gnathostoma spinigerum TaxID=75299 RepID=A0ABD6EJ40_9BILA
MFMRRIIYKRKRSDQICCFLRLKLHLLTYLHSHHLSRKKTDPGTPLPKCRERWIPHMLTSRSPIHSFEVSLFPDAKGECENRFKATIKRECFRIHFSLLSKFRCNMCA